MSKMDEFNRQNIINRRFMHGGVDWGFESAFSNINGGKRLSLVKVPYL